MRKAAAALVVALAVALAATAVLMLGVALHEADRALLRPGCIAHWLGGPKTSAACLDGMVATGARLVYSTLAWWALVGLLLLAKSDRRPGSWLLAVSKGMGLLTGALVMLMVVVPAVVVVVMTVVYPFVLLVGVGIVALVAFVAGSLNRP